MSKSLKSVLFAIAGFIALLVLIAVAIFYLVDTSFYKQRLERAASEALGMEVRVVGRLRMACFPGLHITLDDVHIRNQGMEVAFAKEADLDIDLLPLLHREVRINRIGLQHLKISIKRHRNGTFNFEGAKGISLATDLDKLSLSDGAFLYRDEQSGKGFEVGNLNLEVRSLRLAGENGAEVLKNLSFTAEFACREIRTRDLLISEVKVTCKGEDGLFILHPVTMRLFGGQASGTIGADFSAPVPRYSIHAFLSKFKIEEYLKTLSAKKVAEGSMDFSATLSMRGSTARELKRTTGGEVSLRGKDLTLYGNDLDREFSRFESSQNFNLVDVGALFFAGPLGLALTKGFNFASTFQGSGGSSSISRLLSVWKVKRGVAQAKDVAMVTKQNRIALKGRIDFINERFDDVTIALIDARGCAKVKQKISGPFRNPLVERPNILMSLAGPVLNMLKQARELFTGGKCETFYAGSVPAPK